MSETIEERYEKIAQRLRETSSNSQGFLFAIAIKSLLDDLMTEREKLKKLVDIPPHLSFESAEQWYIGTVRAVGEVLCLEEGED